jgi:hypothetical protein
MAKVAKLVLVSLMTRVIVDEDTPFDDVVEAARKGLSNQLNNDLHDNVEEVFEDTEVPFGILDSDFLK